MGNCPVLFMSEKEEIPDSKFMAECIQLGLIRTLEENDIRERAFYLNSGHILYGLCIGELSDSFLVGLSCSFYRNQNGDYEIKESTSHQVVRLFKGAISMLGFCNRELRDVYFKYLLSLPESFDLLSPERIRLIKEELDKSHYPLTEKITEPYKKPESFEEVPSFMKGYSIVKH